ncbi:MAG: hypothetical protein IH598_00330 [Bacteroidales bacterium]|nr:hypothetical protein [Bacteroidales bacterium]
MKTFKLLFLAVAMLASYTLTAQVAITTDGSDPDGSAMLDVKSTDKGFLPPRMTQAQIEAIATPANGLIVFNTTDEKLYVFMESENVWKEINYGTGTISPPFACGQNLIDPRDSKSYTTVLIGTQCWMAQNLNIGLRINVSVEQSQNTPAEIIEKYCYGDNESNCDTYGGLYQWAEMVQYLNGATNGISWDPVPTGNVQGICPAGWHLPTDAEWTALTTYVSSQSGYLCNSNTSFIAKALAATTIWNSSSNTCAVGNNLSANNATGFTGLPGGLRVTNGTFNNLGITGYFWSSSDGSSTEAWDRSLGYSSALVFRNSYGKGYGFSVRCLRD